MRCQTLSKNDGHTWYAFGQDPGKHDKIIDTNQIVLNSGGETVLLDPGGMEVFPAFLTALSEKVSIDSIKHIFLSHQDPDICSSLLLWRQVCPKEVNIYVPWMWQDFVAHFDVDAKTIPVPDEGMTINLANGRSLEMIPAHYLHSPGNLNLYDPMARLLFSGEIGAATLPHNDSGSFYVKNFSSHVEYMEDFHKRWMVSTDARDAWISQVRRLKVDMIVPQRGLAFKEDDVENFLTWFAEVELGGGIAAMLDEGAVRSAAPKIEAAKPAPKPEPIAEEPKKATPPPPPPPPPAEPEGPFTAKQIELVQSTFSEVAKIKEAAAELFYGRLFEMDPKLESLFSGDLKEQGKALMGMIAVAVNGLNKLDTIVPAVQELGVRHAGYGVAEKDYDTVAGALLWTLEQGLGDLYTPEVAEAWTAVYVVLATTMKDAAKNADTPADTPAGPQPGNADGSLIIKSDASLFARLGGEPAIDIVVDALYTRVVDDPRLSSFYDGVDIAALKKSYKSYLGEIFGGPDQYTGKSLKDAHAALGLDASHVDALIQHFQSVLTDFQVDGGVIGEISQLLDSSKSEVLG
ncbi:MAG: MBL fold metallo-hydrolase [Rhodospirillales bacterium]|jgi:hemoglobin-like flavoprotein|nr:MBL fold metallo-hydrolase [Rhodospirillales bacterium]MBT4040099.1 MBL fold metallo-hydrolase [Rhodospirillales bacterium]MBT4627849.1 MBL fold metallo-hydrolase [Rhodospirillales bacterium]MBT5351389.1 MBL fold metallo-hydrolase [Rhodospirillales bacterium]MBT5522228.1 MBL fold metallo-hydrolase [Rhodospirillales bacterium]